MLYLNLLEKRTQQAMDAIRFSQELCEIGAEVEILSFAKILLKRFEYCQQFKPPVDPKVSLVYLFHLY